MKNITSVIALLLVGTGALVHGATTHRWSLLSSTTKKMDLLHSHVVQLGDYQAEEVPNDMPLKEKSIATSRRYFSPSRNFTAVISVITGTPGSVATHTPDVCYPGSGYKTLKSSVRESLDVPGIGKVSYYVAEFEKKTATRTERHRVRWSWSTEGVWEAPDRPRFSYLRVADLAKIYIVTSLGDGESEKSAEDTPVIRQFVSATFAQYSELLAGR